MSESHIPPPAVDPQAVQEEKEAPVGKPGGFANDPPDPTNPNEAIERYRQKIRPSGP